MPVLQTDLHQMVSFTKDFGPSQGSPPRASAMWVPCDGGKGSGNGIDMRLCWHGEAMVEVAALSPHPHRIDGSVKVARRMGGWMD